MRLDRAGPPVTLTRAVWPWELEHTFQLLFSSADLRLFSPKLPQGSASAVQKVQVLGVRVQFPVCASFLPYQFPAFFKLNARLNNEGLRYIQNGKASDP